MSNILVVDDEAGIRELLQEILNDEGHQVVLAENADEARRFFDRKPPELVLLDIWMPDTDGITLLKEWSANARLSMPVIMMSGHGTIDTAVEATRIGAFDFLEKPIALQKLLHSVNRALRQGTSVAKSEPSVAALGKSPLMLALQKRLRQLASYRGTILLSGEVGSPFEIAGKVVHSSDKNWVAPEDYAWLSSNPIDVLHEAQDGSIFIRDLSRLGKLEQKGLALLASRLDKFNVRLICCCSQPLARMAEETGFDPALFHAISSVSILLPSLREYRDDIPELAKTLLYEFGGSRTDTPRHFDIAALNALRIYHWPLNWEQLRSVVRTLTLTVTKDEICAADVKAVLDQFELSLPSRAGLSGSLSAIDLDLPLREARDQFEKLYFEHHLAKSDGNMSKIAELVGLERTHLYRKLKQLEIKVSKKAD